QASGLDRVEARQRRRLLVHGGAQGGKAVVGQLVAYLRGKRAHDRPVLLGIARRERGAARQLRATLDIDVGGALLGVGRARQDDIGALGPGIAVAALIDDKSLAERVHVDLVGTEQ